MNEGIRWRRSSRSVPQGECVELATDGRVWSAIRDSKNPAGPILTVDVDQFLVAVKKLAS